MMRAEDEAVSWVSTLSTQGVKVLAVLTHFISLFPKNVELTQPEPNST